VKEAQKQRGEVSVAMDGIEWLIRPAEDLHRGEEGKVIAPQVQDYPQIKTGLTAVFAETPVHAYGVELARYPFFDARVEVGDDVDVVAVLGQVPGVIEHDIFRSPGKVGRKRTHPTRHDEYSHLDILHVITVKADEMFRVLRQASDLSVSAVCFRPLARP
jgi:hypothetical protein